jgi:hypothetical protein
MAILGIIQVFPIVKTYLADSKASVNIQKFEDATNQNTETNQIKTKNDDTLNKTKILNDK